MSSASSDDLMGWAAWRTCIHVCDLPASDSRMNLAKSFFGTRARNSCAPSRAVATVCAEPEASVDQAPDRGAALLHLAGLMLGLA